MIPNIVSCRLYPIVCAWIGFVSFQCTCLGYPTDFDNSRYVSCLGPFLAQHALCTCADVQKRLLHRVKREYIQTSIY